ncbi:hypothetical protein Tco_0657703 [Tanacetum coccineum]
MKVKGEKEKKKKEGEKREKGRKKMVVAERKRDPPTLEMGNEKEKKKEVGRERNDWEDRWGERKGGRTGGGMKEEWKKGEERKGKRREGRDGLELKGDREARVFFLGSNDDTAEVVAMIAGGSSNLEEKTNTVAWLKDLGLFKGSLGRGLQPLLHILSRETGTGYNTGVCQEMSLRWFHRSTIQDLIYYHPDVIGCNTQYGENYSEIEGSSSESAFAFACKIYNEKLVQTLLKGHSILSLEGSLSGDCDVEKNGSRQQKFLVLRFFDVKEQQGIAMYRFLSSSIVRVRNKV